MEISNNDYQTLRRYEESLWLAETRFNREYMDGVFANDFFEIGRSGRVHSRDDLLSVTGVEIKARLPLENFDIRLISEHVVQITYNSHVEYDGLMASARRSSIWSFTRGRWVLRFHQGTAFEKV